MHNKHRTSIGAALVAAVILAIAGPSASASQSQQHSSQVCLPKDGYASQHTEATLTFDARTAYAPPVHIESIQNFNHLAGVVQRDQSSIQIHSLKNIAVTDVPIIARHHGGDGVSIDSSPGNPAINSTKAFGINEVNEQTITATAEIYGTSYRMTGSFARATIGIDVNNLGFGSCGIAAPTGPPVVVS